MKKKGPEEGEEGEEIGKSGGQDERDGDEERIVRKSGTTSGKICKTISAAEMGKDLKL